MPQSGINSEMGDMGGADFDSTPLPQGDPSMGMGDPNAMGTDPNMMGGADDMMGDAEPTADGEVDNKAEKASGELSELLPDANDSTVNYVMKMITTAVSKNPNVGKDDLEGYADKLTSNEDADDDGEGAQPEEDASAETQSMQESVRSLESIIDNVLNEVFGDTEDKKSRPNLSRRNHSTKKDNPFVAN